MYRETFWHYKVYCSDVLQVSFNIMQVLKIIDDFSKTIKVAALIPI